MAGQASRQLYKRKQAHRGSGFQRRLVCWLCLSFLLVVVFAQVVILKHMSLAHNPSSTPLSTTPISGTKKATSKMNGAKDSVDHLTKTAVRTNIYKKDDEKHQSTTTESANAQSTGLIYETPPDMSTFPTWIQEYVQWHQDMRRKFPDMNLFTNPDAPNLLVRTCLGICGGLHDRIGQLPWDLYLAKATGRVLLMAWQRPRAIENFLIPSELMNWTIPFEAQFGFDDIRKVRNETELFLDYPEDHPEEKFWSEDMDKAIARATTGEFRSVKLLRHRLLGHLGEAALEDRLAKEGFHEKIHNAPIFGNIFWLFFKPSNVVHKQVQQVMTDLQLVPRSYSAVHCRVRHPKATSSSVLVLGKNPKYPADKTGLPWEGDTRQFALDVARRALHCSFDVNQDKVYFLSDSNDLVRHVSLELQNSTFLSHNQAEVDARLLKVVTMGSVVARDVTEENAHIDRQKGRPAEAYYATFIDLMIAIHAKCVVYGIGYYAAFGAKISGTECSYLYEKESWGKQVAKQAHICANYAD